MEISDERRYMISKHIASEISSSFTLNHFMDRLQELYDEAAKKMADVGPMDTAAIMDLQVDMRLAARLAELIEEYKDLGSERKPDYESESEQPTSDEESDYVD